MSTKSKRVSVPAMGNDDFNRMYIVLENFGTTVSVPTMGNDDFNCRPLG